MAKNNKKKAKKDAKRKTAAPKKVPVKKILYVAIIFALIILAALLLRNSRYFRLEEIEIIDRSRATYLGASGLLRIYKGRNIFDIDMVSLASRIKDNYPTVEEAIVKRILPNRLEIDIVPRLAVGKIKTRFGYFPIDRTGMILSPDIKTERLPVIIGFSMWRSPHVGERLKNQQLENTFLLLDAIKETSVLSDYDVTTIDASSQRDLSFYLGSGIEVKIGSEDFSNRLKSLKSTLANPQLDKDNIKYIDLRFKDVVIGPK